MADCEVILFNVEDIISAVNTFFELGIDENIDTCGYCIRVIHQACPGIYVPFTATTDDIRTLDEANVDFIRLRSLSSDEYQYIH